MRAGLRVTWRPAGNRPVAAQPRRRRGNPGAAGSIRVDIAGSGRRDGSSRKPGAGQADARPSRRRPATRGGVAPGPRDRNRCAIGWRREAAIRASHEACDQAAISRALRRIPAAFCDRKIATTPASNVDLRSCCTCARAMLANRVFCGGGATPCRPETEVPLEFPRTLIAGHARGDDCRAWPIRPAR